MPCPECPQTRQARWLAAKERSNARVSPDHGSEGEDVQLRWRPAHEENSDVIQLYKGLPLLAPTAKNVFPRGVDGRPSWWDIFQINNSKKASVDIQDLNPRH